MNYISCDGLELGYTSKWEGHEGPNHVGWVGGEVRYLESVDDDGAVFTDWSLWNAHASEYNFPNWEELEITLNDR